MASNVYLQYLNGNSMLQNYFMENIENFKSKTLRFNKANVSTIAPGNSYCLETNLTLKKMPHHILAYFVCRHCCKSFYHAHMLREEHVCEGDNCMCYNGFDPEVSARRSSPWGNRGYCKLDCTYSNKEGNIILSNIDYVYFNNEGVLCFCVTSYSDDNTEIKIRDNVPGRPRIALGRLHYVKLTDTHYKRFIDNRTLLRSGTVCTSKTDLSFVICKTLNCELNCHGL